MDKGLHIDVNQLLAGVAGAIAGTDWHKIKTVFQGVMTVFIGAASALYLTPLVARHIGWSTPEQMLGLSFLLGTLGLRAVQGINKIVESQINKMGNN
jgi:hypothetical protein